MQTSTQPALNLTTLAPEIREIILDHVLNQGIILFEKRNKQLAARNWSLVFLRTCRLFHVEGTAALQKAFRRTTIQYHSFPFNSPPYDKLDDGDIVHFRFALYNGHRFRSMEILRIPFAVPDFHYFSNLKRLTIGTFKHRVWTFSLPKMAFPRFTDILNKGLLDAWDAVCQRMRSDHRRFPFANFILDLIDRRQGEGSGKKGFGLFVRLIIEAQTSGVST